MLRAELADIEAHTLSLITDGRSVNDIVDESSSVLRNSSDKRVLKTRNIVFCPGCHRCHVSLVVAGQRGRM